ncbi:MAG: twin-arginine translocase TatA/TatE family subunit [Nitrospiraceae bacterium]
MFGTLGFSELIIILAIILIIFGAGRLPQIGEGIGKALKGFKKEVHEAPPPLDPQAEAQSGSPAATSQPPIEEAQVVARAAQTPDAARPSAPYQPGPELTPGTTAALMAGGGGPQRAQPPRPPSAHPASGTGTTQPVTANQPAQPAQPSAPMTMEERMAQSPPAARGAYPALPPTAHAKPVTKRPSAVVNKDAVARVQAQQAALKAKGGPPPQTPGAKQAGLSPQDMQGLGESLGDTLRTFRQAASDVRNSIDPEMRTIRAEMDAAQKEIEQSVEAAKQMPAGQDDSPPKSS